MAIGQLLFVALVAGTIGLGASNLADPLIVDNTKLFSNAEISDGIEQLVEAFDDLAVAPATGMPSKIISNAIAIYNRNEPLYD